MADLSDYERRQLALRIMRYAHTTYAQLAIHPQGASKAQVQSAEAKFAGRLLQVSIETDLRVLNGVKVVVWRPAKGRLRNEPRVLTGEDLRDYLEEFDHGTRLVLAQTFVDVAHQEAGAYWNMSPQDRIRHQVAAQEALNAAANV